MLVMRTQGVPMEDAEKIVDAVGEDNVLDYYGAQWGQ